MRRLLPALLGTGVCLMAATPAHALLCGTFLNPMTVSATAMSFGDYIATATSPKTTTGTITISCALGLDVAPSFTVGISVGTSGSYTMRKMARGARRLNYQLYTAADFATVWGDGSNGTGTMAFSGALLTQPVVYTAHGRLPAGQWSGSGLYQDTLVVTVTF